MKSLILKKGRDESLLRHHPWIFSGAIAQTEDASADGETVNILSADRRWLASAAYSSRSQIRARVWSFDQRDVIDSAFFRHRIERATQARDPRILGDPAAACRIVYSESDGLPGLIVDRYRDVLVCQFLSAGAEHWKPDIVRHLADLVPHSSIYERSDVDVREKEGLPSRTALLAGVEPPPLVEIREADATFLVDVRKGHKTGFYLDQRVNRMMIPDFSKGAEVLNAFSYTGAFGICALRGGADRLTNVDTSEETLDLLRRNIQANGFDDRPVENIAGDAFQVLRRFRDSARQFDIIILDPPKFAASASQVEGASRGYKDINLLAFKLLRPGGILFTFSCSGHIAPPLFQKIVADAALDAGRRAAVIRFLGQSPDHPVALNFPEAHYLKGLVCRVE